jgi:hypothetical protein
MSKFKDKLKKIKEGKAVATIKKVGNSLPIVKGVNSVKGWVKRGKNTEPEAQTMTAIGTSKPRLIKSDIDAPSVLEKLATPSTQINTSLSEDAAQDTSETSTDARLANPNKETTTPTSPTDTAKPNKVKNWLAKNWYIPVAVIVVVGVAIYFIKRKK